MDIPGTSKNCDCTHSGTSCASSSSSTANSGQESTSSANPPSSVNSFSSVPRANHQAQQQQPSSAGYAEAGPSSMPVNTLCVMSNGGERNPINSLSNEFGKLALAAGGAYGGGSGSMAVNTYMAQNQRADDMPFNSLPGASSELSGSSSSLSGPANNPVAQTNSNQSYNWQASKWSVKERLSSIFNRELLADVHFIVGKGTPPMRIPAHKFILSIGSAVFNAMFNSDLATQEDEIELPDVEPPAFLALLRFLYTDEVQIGPETVMTTLYTAKKYAVPALEKHCVDFLKTHLNSENAFMLLTQASLFDESVLAQMCLDTIDKNTVEALQAEGFLDIDYDTLCKVLERDSLRVREIILFHAVVRWAEATCQRNGLTSNPENQRSVLNRSLYLIRFPLMTVEEFATEVVQSGILTDREVVNLFLYFTVNPKPAISFPDAQRCSITGKEQIVHRFARTESRWGYSGTSDRIRFFVDRRIFIIGFGLYGSIHGPTDYECNIQIIHTGSGKVLASNDTQFSCDGTPKTCRVQFKLPVEILPNTNYTACATLKGSDSHYGTGGSRKVVVDLHGGGKVTFAFSYAAGCNNGTSIEDGQIPELIFYV